MRLSVCKDCGAKHIMHHACMTCGKYNGRVVIDIQAQIERKAKKNKEKETAGSVK
jgi:predicted ATP-dependent serine protease